MQQPRGLAVVTVDGSTPSTLQGRALQRGEETPRRLLEEMDAGDAVTGGERSLTSYVSWRAPGGCWRVAWRF